MKLCSVLLVLGVVVLGRTPATAQDIPERLALAFPSPEWKRTDDGSQFEFTCQTAACALGTFVRLSVAEDAGAEATLRDPDFAERVRAGFTQAPPGQGPPKILTLERNAAGPIPHVTVETECDCESPKVFVAAQLLARGNTRVLLLANAPTRDGAAANLNALKRVMVGP